MIEYRIVFDISGTNELLHSDTSVNDLLKPYQLLTKELEREGLSVITPNQIPSKRSGKTHYIFLSFRSHKTYKKFIKRDDVTMGFFFLIEPPVVRPDRWASLPELTEAFRKVYLYNTEGEGYSIKNVNKSKLNRFSLPQAFGQVEEKYWNEKKNKNICLINANKLPRSYKNELYGERIRAFLGITETFPGDLYGYGWGSWKNPASYRPAYLFNRKQLLKRYKGVISSKFDVLAQYKFSICFENAMMPGLVTEKIFDCFIVGSIPIYLGAPNIENFVPKSCFIDARDFESYDELAFFIRDMKQEEIREFRKSIREYIQGERYQAIFSPSSFVKSVKNGVLELVMELKSSM